MPSIAQIAAASGSNTIASGLQNLLVTNDIVNDTMPIVDYFRPVDVAIINGTIGNDSLVAPSVASIVYAGAGNDTILSGAGSNTIDGGTGRDTASYSASKSGVNVSLSTHIGVGGDAQGDYLYNIENLMGSANNDTLTGDIGANSLFGGAGNDVLAGGAGSDTLNGGDGVDTADYSASAAAVNVNLVNGYGQGGDAQNDRLISIDNVTGSALNDTLKGDANANVLDGGAGNDILVGGAGADILKGGAGIDTADYSISEAGIKIDLTAGTGVGGDAQGDELSGIENVIGTKQADVLKGNQDYNILTGGAGNDTFIVSEGYDKYLGGEGVDTVDFSASSEAANVNLVLGYSGIADAASNSYTSIENVIGSSKTDRISGNDVNNVIEGGASADYLDGGKGVDTLDYSSSKAGVQVNLETGVNKLGDAEGDVTSNFENVTGSAQADTLTGNKGNNSLDGGKGNDKFIVSAGNDTYNGGDGVDTVDYSSAKSGINVNLNGSSGTADSSYQRLTSIENVQASNFNDHINGNASNNLVFGAAGNDTIYGNEGNDTLNGEAGFDNLLGGAGNDVLVGGAGNDTLNGGDGVDTAIFTGARSEYTISKVGDNYYVQHDVSSAMMTAGGEVIRKGGEDGTDFVSNIENFSFAGQIVKAADLMFITPATSGNDLIKGTNLDDKINGLAGNDSISGEAGNDVLTGSAGNDYLSGGAGNDILAGGNTYDYYGGGARPINDTPIQVTNSTNVMTGGLGNDSFIFKYDAFTNSSDTITDFTRGDKIELSKALAGSFADVMSHATQQGANTVISLYNETITLNNVQKTALTANDFKFVDAGFLPA